MQRMADLVYGMLFRLFECAVGIKRVFFKEETDLVAGIKKVIVGRAALFVCREDRFNFTRIECAHEFLCLCSQTIAFVWSHKVFKHYKAIVLKSF